MKFGWTITQISLRDSPRKSAALSIFNSQPRVVVKIDIGPLSKILGYDKHLARLFTIVSQQNFLLHTTLSTTHASSSLYSLSCTNTFSCSDFLELRHPFNNPPTHPWRVFGSPTSAYNLTAWIDLSMQSLNCAPTSKWSPALQRVWAVLSHLVMGVLYDARTSGCLRPSRALTRNPSFWLCTSFTHALLLFLRMTGTEFV